MKYLFNTMHFIRDFIRQYWFALTCLMLGSITLLSLLPVEQMPRVAGGDKTHHIVAYALLMLPTALRKPVYWPWIAMAFICWGILIEFLQPFSNRHFEIMDMIANATGVLLAIAFAELINRLIKTAV